MEDQREDFSLGLANQIHEARREKYFFPSQKENNARGGRGILIMRVYLKDYNSEAKLVKFGNL